MDEDDHPPVVPPETDTDDSASDIEHPDVVRLKV